MNDDPQNEERRRSSTSSGSGHDGDEPPAVADAGPHEGQRPPGDDLQRVEHDVQRNGQQHSEGSPSEVIDAELVEEVTRQIAGSAYVWSAPAPSPETLEAYRQVDPTFADRAMRMAEQSISASNHEKEWLAKGDVDALKRGQYLSLIHI